MPYFIKQLTFCFLVFNFTAYTTADPVRFAAIGDTPYFKSGIENVSKTLTLMGAQGIPFVIHIGDIFGGGIDCPRERYEARAKIFSKTPMPFMITIGDNEFNDCPSPKQARALFREVILGNPPLHQSVSGTDSSFTPLHVTRQADMIENVTWSHKNIEFIMLVLPGLPGTYALSRDEINGMLDTNIDFLVEGFKNAKRENRDAIVLVMHSDPAECNAYRCSDFNKKIIQEVRDFGKPVLLINGSNHDRVFLENGYQGVSMWSHLRPGWEPTSWWPEVLFSNENQKFLVKWHDTPFWGDE